MRLRHASCTKFRKSDRSRYTNRKSSCQKRVHFSKWRLQNDDVKEYELIFHGENLAEAWLAGWLAGWLLGGPKCVKNAYP